MRMQEQTLLAQLHDIYGMIHIPFWQTPLFYWTLGGLGLLIGGGGWYYLTRRRKSRDMWEQALNELEQLECRGLVDNQEQKLFYSELTRIIKEYLQKLFGITLTSKTDDELLVMSESLEITQEVRQKLKNILDGAVFIKFAQEAAVRERMQRDLLSGKELINATRPRKT